MSYNNVYNVLRYLILAQIKVFLWSNCEKVLEYPEKMLLSNFKATHTVRLDNCNMYICSGIINYLNDIHIISKTFVC